MQVGMKLSGDDLIGQPEGKLNNPKVRPGSVLENLRRSLSESLKDIIPGAKVTWDPFYTLNIGFQIPLIWRFLTSTKYPQRITILKLT
jgi:hypothetical protein